jgi:acetyl-CoA carboxylase alpha subunit
MAALPDIKVPSRVSGVGWYTVMSPFGVAIILGQTESTGNARNEINTRTINARQILNLQVIDL